MNARTGALLAAVGTTLSVVSGLLSNFLSWLPLAVHGNGSALNALPTLVPTWLMSFVFGAALPLFLFLLYRSQPLSSIPSSLKKAAWVAVLASGLSAIASVLRWSADLLRAGSVRDAAERMSHPIVWTLQWAHHLVVSPLISLFAALTLLLFFLAVARREIGTLTAPLGLRRAATYACVVAALGVAMSLLAVYSTFAFPGSSYRRELLQAGPSTFVWWNLTLPPAISVLNQASRAAFFFVFCLKVRVPQSNQRLSSGE